MLVACFGQSKQYWKNARHYASSIEPWEVEQLNVSDFQLTRRAFSVTLDAAKTEAWMHPVNKT